MNSRDGPPEAANVLILRAWIEPSRPDGVRVRATRVVHGRELPLITVTSIPAAAAVIEYWLEGVLAGRTDEPL